MAEPDLGYNVHHIIQSFNPGESKEQMNNWLRNMVFNKGLRAQLETQSMLTGMLHIEFDLFENEITSTEIKQDFERGIIPSRMSAFERLYLSLNQKDFSGNVETFHTVMNFIGEFFQSGKAEAFVDNVVASSENLKQTTEDARYMLRTLRTYKKGESDDSPVAQLCDLIVALQGIVDCRPPGNCRKSRHGHDEPQAETARYDGRSQFHVGDAQFHHDQSRPQAGRRHCGRKTAHQDNRKDNLAYRRPVRGTCPLPPGDDGGDTRRHGDCANHPQAHGRHA